MQRLHRLQETLQPSPRMPVLFVGHGNPMNALYDNEFTKTWAKVGGTLPTPQAIVVISAHWLTKGTHITDAPTQPLIYDVFNFPPELYEVTYPAKGSHELAQLLQEQLIAYEAKLDSTWGLDHGTWSVLTHLAPEPKVPVLQISLDYTTSLAESIELFSHLKELRKRGVLFIGSGNIVHNLRAVNWHSNKAYDWALEFDTLSAEAMSRHDIEKLVKPQKISSTASFAIPTDDHYRPMLAAMALLDTDEELHYFNDAIDMGSIGMRSFIAGK